MLLGNGYDVDATRRFASILADRPGALAYWCGRNETSRCSCRRPRSQPRHRARPRQRLLRRVVNDEHVADGVHGQAPGKPELPYGGNRRDVVGGACGVLGYRPPFRATGVIGDPHVPVLVQGHIRRIIDVCVAIADGGDELGVAGPDSVCGHRVTAVVADPQMPGRVHRPSGSSSAVAPPVMVRTGRTWLHWTNRAGGCR